MHKKQGLILPITLFSYFLILMDNSIIFTSSLQIGKSFGFSATELSWVSNAYTLTFGGFLLLSGRLLDLYGRKKVFLAGLIIFGISSLVIGYTQSGLLLILMRGIQGIGSSIIAPATLALIMDYYQGEQRARAISFYGATAGIGASVGLILGGGLTTFVSWRAGFIINVPFVLILVIATYRFIKSSAVHQQKLDIAGSALSILGLTALIYGLSEGNWLLMGMGISLLAGFLFWESKTKHPILPLLLFQNRTRFSAYLVRMLFMMAMLPLWFYLP